MRDQKVGRRSARATAHCCKEGTTSALKFRANRVRIEGDLSYRDLIKVGANRDDVGARRMRVHAV
jgi:hypothetical protein